MSRFSNPVPQFWLNNGQVASMGRMEFYENKNYSSFKDTFSHPDNTVENTNPVKLDDQGRLPPCFGEGLYSVKLYAANPDNPFINGELVWTRDDVDLSAGSNAAFSMWSPVQPYGIGSIAKDGEPYYRLYGAATSVGEQPSANPLKWEKIVFITEHVPARSYPDGYIVFKDGGLYESNLNDNVTTPPSASWNSLTFNGTVTGDISVFGKVIVGPSAGTKYYIDNLGRSSNDGVTYTAIANRKSVRVALNGLFDVGASIVAEKVGNVVTITSCGVITHANAGTIVSVGAIPSEYRIGSDYAPGTNLSFTSNSSPSGYISTVQINQDGTIRVSYVDYAGAAISRTSFGSGFSLSYTITSATP